MIFFLGGLKRGKASATPDVMLLNHVNIETGLTKTTCSCYRNLHPTALAESKRKVTV